MEGDSSDPVPDPYFVGISIHTLRMEGDPVDYLIICRMQVFQSTPSAWRVTSVLIDSLYIPIFQSTPSAWRVTNSIVATFTSIMISIHTLRMEGDSKSAQKSRTLLFKVTDLRRNCRPDVHERTEGSSFADRFYMVSFIFVVRRCPETTGHFWFAPARKALLSTVLHHQDAFRLVAGISSEMLYFLFILIA